jgi:hypothetical protein
MRQPIQYNELGHLGMAATSTPLHTEGIIFCDQENLFAEKRNLSEH